MGKWASEEAGEGTCSSRSDTSLRSAAVSGRGEGDWAGGVHSKLTHMWLDFSARKDFSSTLQEYDILPSRNQIPNELLLANVENYGKSKSVGSHKWKIRAPFRFCSDELKVSIEDLQG